MKLKELLKSYGLQVINIKSGRDTISPIDGRGRVELPIAALNSILSILYDEISFARIDISLNDYDDGAIVKVSPAIKALWFINCSSDGELDFKSKVLIPLTISSSFKAHGFAAEGFSKVVNVNF